MKKNIVALLTLGLLGHSIAANAALVTYRFTVDGGSEGPLAGVSSQGFFSFDDERLCFGRVTYFRVCPNPARWR